MPSTTCPVCRRELQVAAYEKGRSLTCPRCLAEIANPNVQVQAGSPPAPAPEPQAGIPLCAECGKVVEKGWRVCPFCAAPLERARRFAPVPSMEDDVRRDSTGITGALIALGVLVIIGVVLLCAGAPDAFNLGSPEGLILVAVVLAVLLSIGLVLLLVRKKPSGQGIDRLVGPLRRQAPGQPSGGITLSGCAGAAVILLAVVGGIVIFLFVTCTAMLTTGVIR